jgi:hypothetical protein
MQQKPPDSARTEPPKQKTKTEQEEKEEKIQQGGWFTAKAATASAHMRSIAARMPSLNEKAAR